MKRQGPLLKTYSEFQDGDHWALNQVQGPSRCGALCNCTGWVPVKPTLSPGSQVPAPTCPLERQITYFAVYIVHFLPKFLMCVIHGHNDYIPW